MIRYATSGTLTLALLLLAACGGGKEQVAAPASDAASMTVAEASLPAAVPVDASLKLVDKPSVPPRDDCPRTGAFGEFRKQFESAVAARDFAKLLPLLDPDVKIGFGGDDGFDAFKRQWKVEEGKASTLWPELDALVKLGCGVTVGGEGGKAYAMPTMFLADLGDRDVFETLISGPNAILRARPAADAEPVARLNWTVLTINPTIYDEGSKPGLKGWWRVTADDKTTGWLADADARSTVDYRVLFNETKQGWKITALLAGD